MSTQTTELAKRGPRGVVARQSDFLTEEDVELVRDLIIQTMGRDQALNADEFKQFIYVCRARRLNPLLRQIYAVRRKGKVVHQTSIDGFRAIAARTRIHAGTDEPVNEGTPGKAGFVAHVTVYKLVGGIRCPFTAPATWEEYCPEDPKEAWMWRKMPRNQLGKCAEALALRKAFPEDLGGLYTDDEMAQAGSVVEVAATDVTARPVTTTVVPPPPPAALPPAKARKGKAAPAPHPATDTRSMQAVDKDGPKISREQQHLLFAVAKEQGIDHDKLKAMVLAFLGVESTKDIPRANFDALIKYVEFRPEAEGQEEVIS